MKILITGGAGFIGSHTADRLLEEGHEVVVLDALIPPVHPDGVVPDYFNPKIEFHRGDVRDRALLRDLLHGVNAVYHLAAHQDYLPKFSLSFDVNVVSTALLYEIIVAERLNLSRVVIASSQAAMGEGLHYCPDDGLQIPGMRSESALMQGHWDILCPQCNKTLIWQPTPETVANPQNPYGMSKYYQETVAINLGRQYDIPTVALRYSIVQGPRQSIYNAYSGACRIFCLSYLQGVAPTIYEDGHSIRDYVNITDVIDANLIALEEDKAVGQIFNVGSGQPMTTRQLAATVQRQYGSDIAPRISGEYRFGDTRHIVSDTTKLQALGWKPKYTVADSVSEYAHWIDNLDGLDGILRDANSRMRDLGVVRQAVR